MGPCVFHLRSSLVLLFLAVLCLPVACRKRVADAGADDGASVLALVETWPVETRLDSPSLADAHQVWPAMIDRARETIDLAQFYVSSSPGGRLEPVLAALRRAAARKVRVRLLIDEKFFANYPEPANTLGQDPGIEVRRLDLRALGGVMHAKYFVIDGRELFLGSQNLDWRSLEHIHELGLRVRDPAVAGVFSRLFARDWEAAGGEPAPDGPVEAGPFRVRLDGQDLTLRPAASPQEDLPPGLPWDLPELVRLIDEATGALDLELLSYRTRTAEGGRWTVLDDALRRAAGRKVRIRMLVSEWARTDDGGRDLASLAELPGISVRVLEVPESKKGPIPFARVAHAKYLVTDGRRAWIGTSNWEKSYFHASRNVSLFIDGKAVVDGITAFFEHAWNSPLARPLRP